MMDVPAELRAIAIDIAAGSPAPSVTVRDLLSWFLAQRRGYGIVLRIRSALEAAGLITEPDFESAYIDSFISFRPAVVMVSAATIEGNDIIVATGQVGIAPSPDGAGSSASASDPTYRISRPEASTNKPIFIAPTATRNEAITIMLDPRLRAKTG
jgi:hypothetical protein